MWPGADDKGSANATKNITEINRNSMQTDEASVIEQYGAQLQ